MATKGRIAKGVKKRRKFILTVGDEGGILVYMEGNKVLRRLFAQSPDPEDTKHFEALLKNDTNATIALLIDTMDQTYVQQTLPPVSPLSVNKLIERRLARDFAKEDIKGAIPLGRSKEGRKDWNYMFVSIANVPPLSGWIAFVAERPNELTGLFLLPVEAQNFLQQFMKRLAPKGKSDLKETLQKLKPQAKKKPKEGESEEESRENARWHIIVSHHKVGGFRQIVFKDGKLIFTRLAQPIGESTPEVIAGNIEQELANTSEYLKRLSFHPKDGLDISIIVADEIRQYLTLDNDLFWHTHIKTPHEVATLFNLEKATEAADHFGDVVFASVFGIIPRPRLRFSTPLLDQFLQVYTIQKAIKIGAGVAIPAMLLYTMWSGYQIMDIRKDIEFAESKYQQALKQYKELEAKTTSLPADVNEITDIVDLHQNLSKDQQNPLSLVSMFSELMDENTLVSSFTWVGKNALPSSRGSGMQLPVNAEFAVEFLNNDGGVEQFLERTQGFSQKVETIFDEYTVTYSNLPGLVTRQDSIQIDFDTGKSTLEPTLPEKDVTIQYSIKGPGKIDPKAKNKRSRRR